MEIPVRFELTNNEVAARPLRPLGQGIICRKERRRVFIPSKRNTLRTLKEISDALVIQLLGDGLAPDAL